MSCSVINCRNRTADGLKMAQFLKNVMRRRMWHIDVVDKSGHQMKIIEYAMYVSCELADMVLPSDGQ